MGQYTVAGSKLFILPQLAENRASSEYDILFDFPWNIVVEIIFIQRPEKGAGVNTAEHTSYPTYISGIPSQEV